MRLHALQHVPFEELANIEIWAKEKGHQISMTQLFKDEHLPRMSDFDWLVILGGPMNVYEEKKYPWLAREKRLIEQAINSRKIVLGICLGAQLIADVLGSRVYKNRYKEIGWFPISLTPEAKGSPVFKALPDERFIAFHWHGDTFDLPPGCFRMAESEGCVNQAFEYNDRVIGLQFHLESSTESIRLLLQNCGDELVEGEYIQNAEAILSHQIHLNEINRIMTVLLDNIGN
jgi:GMP synthase-like glutamine amidotransferase